MSTDHDHESLADELLDAVRSVTTSLFRTVGNRPAECGSGLLYRNDGRLFLLSVIHILDSGGWTMETGCIIKGRALLISIPPMNWVTHATLDAEGQLTSRSSDGLAWVELDVSKLSTDPMIQGRDVNLNVYEGSLTERARTDMRYDFAAGVPRGIDPFNGDLLREPVFEVDMVYDGDDQRGFNRFKVAGKHRGDEYKGASGAPILDAEGTIVALVQGGCPHAGIIYGVPLALYSRVLNLPLVSPVPGASGSGGAQS